MEVKLDSTKRAIANYEKVAQRISQEHAAKELRRFMEKAQAQLKGSGIPAQARQDMENDVAVLNEILGV